MSEMGFIVSRRGCLHLGNLTYHTSYRHMQNLTLIMVYSPGPRC